MRELTADEIRAGFINITTDEAERVPMPGLHEVIWSEREFLGWLDPSLAGRGYLTLDTDAGVVSIVVRRADSLGGRAVSAMCSMCHSTQPISQVSLFSAARAGQRGRDGSTVGTYICDDLDCPHKIRMLPANSPSGLIPGDLLTGRSRGLLPRLEGFPTVVAGA